MMWRRMGTASPAFLCAAVLLSPACMHDLGASRQESLVIRDSRTGTIVFDGDEGRFSSHRNTSAFTIEEIGSLHVSLLPGQPPMCMLETDGPQLEKLWTFQSRDCAVSRVGDSFCFLNARLPEMASRAHGDSFAVLIDGCISPRPMPILPAEPEEAIDAPDPVLICDPLQGSLAGRTDVAEVHVISATAPDAEARLSNGGWRICSTGRRCDRRWVQYDVVFKDGSTTTIWTGHSCSH
jgi:hypothetical protein